MNRLIICFAAGLVASSGLAQKQPALKDQKDKASYSIGHDIGTTFKKQSMELNPDILLAGLKDALAGKEAMPKEERDKTLQEFQKEMQEKQAAATKMVATAEASKREMVKQHFEQMAKMAAGCYALVDYVNFKGEGVLATERYAGQGWGLLQVLEGMAEESANHDPVRSFADSAKRVLSARVHNAPPNRNEARWLPGWLNRINTYVEN